MWHSGSKYQRIGVSVKANRKRLKDVLASGARNFDPFSVALELVEFPLFDNFFPDLDNFRDLDVFSDFLACSISFPPTPTPSTSPSPSFFPEAGLLLSFLLEADLLPSFLLGADSLGNPVVFSIEVSGAAILLKP